MPELKSYVRPSLATVYGICSVCYRIAIGCESVGDERPIGAWCLGFGTKHEFPDYRAGALVVAAASTGATRFAPPEPAISHSLEAVCLMCVIGTPIQQLDED